MFGRTMFLFGRKSCRHFFLARKFIRSKIFEIKGALCYGDVAVFCSKLLKYSTKTLIASMKLLFEHRVENIKDFTNEKLTILSFY